MNALHVLVLTFASLGAGETVLLDFSGEGCAPCRQMMPVVESLAAAGHPVRMVDTAREPELAQRLHVQALPTFVMLVDGREVDRSVGLTSRERLLAMLAKAPRPGGDGAVPHWTDWQFPGRGNGSAMPVRPTSNPLNLYNSGATQPTQRNGALEQKLLAMTVRLRVNDPQGHSFGTGTIVDAADGEALILTCAHLFRDSQGRGQITADLFCSGGQHGIPAKLLGYDMQRDVALVAIRPGIPVPAAKVAPAGYRPRRGEPVISIGCNKGADPTVMASRVLDTDKVLSPPTIEVAGQPVVGRSGGGLFNAEGEVIGVCYAADPQDNEGFYAATSSVHAELDRRGLSFVYRPRSPSDSVESRLASTRMPELPQELPASLSAAQQQAAQQAGRKSAAPSSVALTPEEVQALNYDEQALLAAVNAGKISPEFLQKLVLRSAQEDSQMLTSRRIEPEPPPAPPQPSIGTIPQRLPQRSWGE